MIKVELPLLENKEVEIVLYTDVKLTHWDKLLMRELIMKYDIFENEDELNENIEFVKDNINLYDMDNNKIGIDEFDLYIDPENEYELELRLKPTPEYLKENKYNGGVVLIIY